MTQSKLDVPDYVRDPRVRVMASASGGKDSTALLLALREADVPYRAVFADTGWEAPETYDYLDLLRERLGIPIAVVGVPGGMESRMRHRANFPSRMQRWCTSELKIAPIQEWRRVWEGAECVEVVNANGVRGQESAKRAALGEWAFEDAWDGYIWRPLLTWSVEDVIAIHKRHGVPMNPLYHRGHDRVGCYPCIYAGKNEIALVAKHAPERIEQIAALEREFTIERRARNEVRPDRNAQEQVTYFSAKQAVVKRDPVSHCKRRFWSPMDIATTVAWARTSHGGKQQVLFELPPEGGCFRWGVCEPPVRDGGDV